MALSLWRGVGDANKRLQCDGVSESLTDSARTVKHYLTSRTRDSMNGIEDSSG